MTCVIEIQGKVRSPTLIYCPAYLRPLKKTIIVKGLPKAPALSSIYLAASRVKYNLRPTMP